LTDAQRKQVIDKLGVVQEFMSKVRTELDTKPKYLDPSASLAQINTQLDLLAAEAKGIFSTPPPKPETTTAAPTDAPKEEEKPDAEG